MILSSVSGSATWSDSDIVYHPQTAISVGYILQPTLEFGFYDEIVEIWSAAA